MNINAYIYFLKEVIRVDYAYNGNMTYNESNDTNRLDILNQKLISCFNDTPKEKEAFRFFVLNCFEIVIDQNGVVSGMKAYEHLKEMKSESICCNEDSISVRVKVENSEKIMTQEELQLIIIDYILVFLRKNIRESFLIYGNSLDEAAVKHIEQLFRKRNQVVTCKAFSEFSTTFDNSVVVKRGNQRYFTSIRMGSLEEEEMKEYYEKRGKKSESDSGQNEFSSNSLFCRTGDSQYVSLLDEVGVTKVYFPLCSQESDVINFNIYIKDVMQRMKFVGGIRAVGKRESALPRIVLFVYCQQYNQCRVFRLLLLDIEKHTEKSFIFGNWENEVNSMDWDYSYPILENNPLFSFIPCVDHVEIRNRECSFYGRLFDLEGKVFYKGKLDNLSSISTTVNSSISLPKPLSTSTVINKWSVLLSYPQSQNDNEITVLQNSSNSSIYVGYFLNNQPHGQGYIMNSQGHIEQLGEFSKGAFVKGDWFTRIQGERCILRGSFKNGKPTGQFKVINRSTNLVFIEGTVKEGEESEGTMYKYNRKVFTGTFHKFVPTNGTMFYLNGTKKYEGDLSAMVPEGRGTFYFYDDSLSITELRKRLQQETLVPLPNYEGEFKRGFYDGEGTLYSALNDHLTLYKGEFKYGKFHGEGFYVVSPVAVPTDNSFILDWTRANLLNQWESHATTHIIVAFKGTFQNNEPVEGTVYFNDGAIAGVKREGNKLVGDVIKNHNNCYRVHGRFEIVNWDLTFLKPINHLIRPIDSKIYVLSIKGAFNPKTKMISEYVLETNTLNATDKQVKHYKLIREPNSWMWRYAEVLPIDTSNEDYIYACNLKQYSLCLNNSNFRGLFLNLIILYIVAFYTISCTVLVRLFSLYTRDNCTRSKKS